MKQYREKGRYAINWNLIATQTVLYAMVLGVTITVLYVNLDKWI